MAKHQLSIPHSLTADEVKTRLETGLGKLESAYGAKCEWTSDTTLRVTRSGLKAAMEIKPSELAVDLELGFLLSAMAGQIRQGIEDKLKAAIAD